MNNFYNDNNSRRTAPRIGECGLTAEDTGFDLWISRQYENGRPNELLKFMTVQVWEREQFQQHGTISPIAKTRFLAELGLTTADLVEGLERYGWLFLSHHGARA